MPCPLVGTPGEHQCGPSVTEETGKPRPEPGEGPASQDRTEGLAGIWPDSEGQRNGDRAVVPTAWWAVTQHLWLLPDVTRACPLTVSHGWLTQQSSTMWSFPRFSLPPTVPIPVLCPVPSGRIS